MRVVFALVLLQIVHGVQELFSSTRCRRETLSTLSRVDFGWPVQRDPKPIVKALARSWTALRSASFGNLSSHLVTDDLAVYLLRKCRTLRVVDEIATKVAEDDALSSVTTGFGLLNEPDAGIDYWRMLNYYEDVCARVE